MVNNKKIFEHLAKKLVVALIVVAGAVFLTACSKDENEKTLRTALEQVYNCPDGELIELSSDGFKADESKIVESGTGVVPFAESEFFNKLEELYLPLFTEEAYESLLNDRIPYKYHLEAGENEYTLKADSIDINKNKTDETKYDFTIHIKYTPKTGEVKTIDIQGTAQFSENGKINYLKTFSDLEKKLSE